MAPSTRRLKRCHLPVAEMLLAVLSVCSAEELEESSEGSSDGEDGKLGKAPVPQDISARRQQIKNKILAVGRLQRVFTVLRYVHRADYSSLHSCTRAHVTEKRQKGPQSWLTLVPILSICLPQGLQEHWEPGLDQTPSVYMVTSGFAVSTKRASFFFHTNRAATNNWSVVYPI